MIGNNSRPLVVRGTTQTDKAIYHTTLKRVLPPAGNILTGDIWRHLQMCVLWSGSIATTQYIWCVVGAFSHMTVLWSDDTLLVALSLVGWDCYSLLVSNARADRLSRYIRTGGFWRTWVVFEVSDAYRSWWTKTQDYNSENRSTQVESAMLKKQLQSEWPIPYAVYHFSLSLVSLHIHFTVLPVAFSALRL